MDVSKHNNNQIAVLDLPNTKKTNPPVGESVFIKIYLAILLLTTR